MALIVRICFALLLGAAAARPALAAPDRSPLQVPLTVRQTAPATPPTQIAGAQDRSFALRVEDGRGAGAGAQVGQALDDGTAVFPIIATSDVSKYVEDITRGVFASWGLHLGEPANGTLLLRYTKLNVAHNNRAVGATYVGDSAIDVTLQSRQGRTLARGRFSGNVDHYGKGRSAENCNEVLGESLTEALTHLLNDAEFRKAWTTARETADSAAPAAAREKRGAVERKSSAPKPPLEERLRKLDELLNSGAITQDEYNKRRAAILDEI